MADDRTSEARLRDAAMELVAESGTKAMTARAVAERAGVTPGLIRHHFGSMAGLLDACDDHVTAEIRQRQGDALDRSSGIDPLASLQIDGRELIIGYLAARLTEDSDRIDRLVDALIGDAEGYLADGVAAGMIAPTRDERRRAALLTIMSLGSLAMHRHIARHLGVDLRSPDFSSHPGYGDYVRIQFEAFEALFTPAAVEHYRGYVDSLEEA